MLLVYNIVGYLKIYFIVFRVKKVLECINMFVLIKF